MRTHEVAARRPSRWRWGTPLVAVGIGVAYLVAGWIGGDLAFGLGGLGVMAVTAVGMLILGRFSETVGGLLDRRDERINALDARATLVAGNVVIVAVIVGFIVEMARGQDGSPYSMLGAIGGVTYVIVLAYLRFGG